jgi:chromosome segregation protein
MRVERIELIGFKSFAEKTVFNFHPGITAIVGPNGCGKSNIVDAFRWVLGEQSAKTLRGDSMEDVIFSGSATKKTKGMAEVTLVISGLDGTTLKNTEINNNSGTGEISVTRRLYRSGESEYLMNKVPCRLKDIKDVFLDTGLELKTYSILEQERIGEILNSKPQDRRFLIEEVAGVMKYKVRRAEALQKLESSQSNLQRLQDIIAEVKRQMNSIDRHARRAEKYKKLFEEIKNIEIKIAKRDLKNLQNELSNLASSENTLKAKEAELSSNLHSSEALIEEKKRVYTDREKTLGEIQSRLHRLEKEVTEGEGKINLLKSDCENLREKLKSLLLQDNELTEKKDATIDSLNKIKDKKSEMDSELSNLEDIVEDKNKLLSELEEEITELEQNLETERRQLFNKAEKVSTIKNEINHLSLMIENINRKTEKNLKDINSVKDNLSSLSNAITEIKDEYLKSEAELSEKQKTREDLGNKLKSKKQELTASEESLHREREELAAMTSRFESLKDLDSSKKNAANENIKILCQVADIFETPPEYETAIEAILGDKLGAAVVEDQHEIRKALQFIKEQKTKRSGFISVNPFRNILPSLFDGKDSIHSYREDLNITDGIIGRAIDFVTVREGFDKVAIALLNDVILVNNLSTAFSLWEVSVTGAGSKPPYFVTLEGEVLEPSGLVFGGIEKGVLKIKRMLKELEKKIAAKKKQIMKSEDSIAVMRKDIAMIENEISSIDEEIFSKEKYCHELKVKITGMEEENARQMKKLEYLSIEADTDQKERENLKKALEEKESNYKALEGEKQFIEERIKSIQNTIAERKRSYEALRSELTDTKLRLTAMKEKMAALIKEEERLSSTILEIEKKKSEIINERLEIEKSLNYKEKEINEKEEELKSKIILIDELQSEASKIKEILEAKAAEISFIETQQRSFASKLDLIRKELNGIEVKKTELSMKLNYLKEDIKKAYSLEIDTADVDDTVSAEEEERLPHLKEKLKELGSVSLGTLEEFEELKTRYEFLTKQQNDLLQSIATLQETIQKINRTTQKRLTEAFNALNEKFKEVFNTLFGKGRAELLLTEGSILEAGIDIIAQPPGKRLQNLMLLSGGEKALTALSLLFAGFMVKPTPLCILDEVDAPLDESNTERFVKLLLELSKNIQFIIITHNRRTMESADYIYGITMEEPGVSKVVSMHLAQAV